MDGRTDGRTDVWTQRRRRRRQRRTSAHPNDTLVTSIRPNVQTITKPNDRPGRRQKQQQQQQHTESLQIKDSMMAGAYKFRMR